MLGEDFGFKIQGSLSGDPGASMKRIVLFRGIQ